MLIIKQMKEEIQKRPMEVDDEDDEVNMQEVVAEGRVEENQNVVEKMKNCIEALFRKMYGGDQDEGVIGQVEGGQRAVVDDTVFNEDWKFNDNRFFRINKNKSYALVVYGGANTANIHRRNGDSYKEIVYSIKLINNQIEHIFYDEFDGSKLLDKFADFNDLDGITKNLGDSKILICNNEDFNSLKGILGKFKKQCPIWLDSCKIDEDLNTEDYNIRLMNGCIINGNLSVLSIDNELSFIELSKNIFNSLQINGCANVSISNNRYLDKIVIENCENVECFDNYNINKENKFLLTKPCDFDDIIQKLNSLNEEFNKLNNKSGVDIDWSTVGIDLNEIVGLNNLVNQLFGEEVKQLNIIKYVINKIEELNVFLLRMNESIKRLKITDVNKSFAMKYKQLFEYIKASIKYQVSNLVNTLPKFDKDRNILGNGNHQIIDKSVGEITIKNTSGNLTVSGFGNRIQVDGVKGKLSVMSNYSEIMVENFNANEINGINNKITIGGNLTEGGGVFEHVSLLKKQISINVLNIDNKDSFIVKTVGVCNFISKNCKIKNFSVLENVLHEIGYEEGEEIDMKVEGDGPIVPTIFNMLFESCAVDRFDFRGICGFKESAWNLGLNDKSSCSIMIDNDIFLSQLRGDVEILNIVSKDANNDVNRNIYVESGKCKLSLKSKSMNNVKLNDFSTFILNGSCEIESLDTICDVQIGLRKFIVNNLKIKAKRLIFGDPVEIVVINGLATDSSLNCIEFSGQFRGSIKLNNFNCRLIVFNKFESIKNVKISNIKFDMPRFKENKSITDLYHGHVDCFEDFGETGVVWKECKKIDFDIDGCTNLLVHGVGNENSSFLIHNNKEIVGVCFRDSTNCSYLIIGNTVAEKYGDILGYIVDRQGLLSNTFEKNVGSKLFLYSKELAESFGGNNCCYFDNEWKPIRAIGSAISNRNGNFLFHNVDNQFGYIYDWDAFMKQSVIPSEITFVYDGDYLNDSYLIKQLIMLNEYDKDNKITKVIIKNFEIHSWLFKYLNKFKEIEFVDCKFDGIIDAVIGDNISSIKIENCRYGNDVNINFNSDSKNKIDVIFDNHVLKMDNKLKCDFMSGEYILKITSSEKLNLIVSGTLLSASFSNVSLSIDGLNVDTIDGNRSTTVLQCEGLNVTNEFVNVVFQCVDINNIYVGGLFSAHVNKLQDHNPLTISDLKAQKINLTGADDFTEVVFNNVSGALSLSKLNVIGNDINANELNCENCSFDANCQIKVTKNNVLFKECKGSLILTCRISEVIVNNSINHQFTFNELQCKQLEIQGKSNVKINVLQGALIDLLVDKESKVYIVENVCRFIKSMKVDGQFCIDNDCKIELDKFTYLKFIELGCVEYQLTGKSNSLESIKISNSNVGFINCVIDDIGCVFKMEIDANVTFNSNSKITINSLNCEFRFNNNKCEKLTINYADKDSSKQNLILYDGCLSSVENFKGNLRLFSTFTLDKNMTIDDNMFVSLIDVEEGKTANIIADKGKTIQIAYKHWKTLSDKNKKKFKVIPVMEISECGEIDSWSDGSINEKSFPTFVDNSVFFDVFKKASVISKWDKSALDLIRYTNGFDINKNLYINSNREDTSNFIKKNDFDKYGRLFDNTIADQKNILYCVCGKSKEVDGFYLYLQNNSGTITEFAAREPRIGKVDASNREKWINKCQIYDNMHSDNITDLDLWMQKIEESLSYFSIPDDGNLVVKPFNLEYTGDIYGSHKNNYITVHNYMLIKDRLKTEKYDVFYVPHITNNSVFGAFLYARSKTTNDLRRLIIFDGLYKFQNDIIVKDYYIISDGILVDDISKASGFVDMADVFNMDNGKVLDRSFFDDIKGNRNGIFIENKESLDGQEAYVSVDTNEFTAINKNIVVMLERLKKENSSELKQSANLYVLKYYKNDTVAGFILCILENGILKKFQLTTDEIERIANEVKVKADKDTRRARIISIVGGILLFIVVVGAIVAGVLWKFEMWIFAPKTKIVEKTVEVIVDNTVLIPRKAEDETAVLIEEDLHKPKLMDDFHIDLSTMRNIDGYLVDDHGRCYEVIRGFYVDVESGRRYDVNGNIITKKSIKIINFNDGGYFVDDIGRFYKHDVSNGLYINVSNGYRYDSYGRFLDVVADNSPIYIVGVEGGLFVDSNGKLYRFNQMDQTYKNIETGYVYGLGGDLLDLGDIDESDVFIHIDNEPVYLDEDNNLYIFNGTTYVSLKGDGEYDLYGDPVLDNIEVDESFSGLL